MEEATPAALVADLVDLLDVVAVDVDLFRGRRSTGGIGRVFGGQVVAQALQAAQRTVAGRAAHSLHGYFMRPGSEAAPIDYRVTRDFDGASFATRRVVAWQDERPILTLTASFQREEEGFHHQAPMPEVPGPETLRSEREWRIEQRESIPERWRAALLRERPIEFRPVAPRRWTDPAPREPVQHSWFRAVAPLGDDPAVHRALLAYASDTALLSTAMLPHGVSWTTPGMQTASLDHALWLHAPARVDEWLLYASDSPWAGGGRGYNRGAIYARDGRLVASVAQEGLIRRRQRGGIDADR
ncbi:acyl-CoA thioesterase II [Sphingomonas sp. RHCKR7]|uniref:acyl-CoA thioesterase n=1 Tax=Sphingomonas folli TaxID=2862497 RepID=UPI001C666A0E|nr:acyl-CoA thioesterase II [Sphingomonas folli]MBW6525278.1 acyl-CoA thioesterase II [Sphingomonas folli]